MIEPQPVTLDDLGAPPFEPTDAQPGSAAKIAILEQRVRFGQPLWHADDRQGPRLHKPVLRRYQAPKGEHPLGHLFAGYNNHSSTATNATKASST